MTDTEKDAYIKRLEKIIMKPGDGERCDGCQLVFEFDDGDYGEDCWLCNSCVAEAREDE